MFVVLIFFDVTHRPQLYTYPLLEIIITVCHEKGRHPYPLTVTYFLNHPLRAGTGKSKLRARFVKYKFEAGAIKYKLGQGARARAKAENLETQVPCKLYIFTALLSMVIYHSITGSCIN